MGETLSVAFSKFFCSQDPDYRDMAYIKIFRSAKTDDGFPRIGSYPYMTLKGTAEKLHWEKVGPKRSLLEKRCHLIGWSRYLTTPS